MSELLHRVALDNIVKYNSYTNEQKIAVLQECIDSGFDINRNNSQILLQSVNSKNYQIIKFLIDNGINIGENILEEACRIKDTPIIKLLLDSGADLHVNNNTIIKCIYDNVELIKLLMEYGFDPNSNNNGVMREACYFGKIDVVKYLLSIGVSCIEPNNQPWLNAFNNSGIYNMKELLLQNGADPNIIKDTKRNISLLEFCVMNCNFEDCELLFKYGANINSCQNIINRNYSCFPYFDDYHSDKIIKLFMLHGLDISEFVNEMKKID